MSPHFSTQSDKVQGPPKLAGLILWGTTISVKKFIAIHSVVEIFQFATKCWTDILTVWHCQAVSMGMAKNS